ncbi:MAG: YraN family protein [Gammaproteobacteria bacterium]
MNLRLFRGRNAESRARRTLEQAGLRTLTTNYRCRVGEIDIIMLDGETLVFIEVRFRADDDFGGALASVDQRKQRKLIRAALHYLGCHPEHANRGTRFDVMAMNGASCDWVRDAFRPL